MAALVKAIDWSQTALGPQATWPQSLRTTVDLCLASNFPIAIIWGPQHTQIYNDGYQPICGGKHPDSMGQDFRQCWAEAWDVIGHSFEQALLGKASFLENRRIFLDRNGYIEETFFSFSFSPIRDKDGSVSGLFHPVIEMTAKILSERRSGVLTDVLERTSTAKTIEEACRLTVDALARHRSDIPFALLYLIDDSGTSAHLAGCTGLKAGENMAPLRLTIQPNTESWLLHEAFTSGRPKEVNDLHERFGLLASGVYPESPTSAVLLPIIPPGAVRPMGVLIAGVSARLALDPAYRTFYDLLSAAAATAIAHGQAFATERRRVLALAEIDRTKTEFLSSISHEFRTPLTLILGPLEESLRDASLSKLPKHREQLQIINRNGLRLLKLVNTLLDFAQIEAGRIHATYQSTDLATLTKDLASTFRSTIEKGCVALEVDCPRLSAPVFVDREMWKKIVLNLLSNAFKYTFQGKITVTLRQTEAHAELLVADTGIGVNKHDLAHLFERFYRVEGAHGRSYEGTGIGLALVEELAKLHCGTVTVTSVDGHGSVFTVRLPLGSSHLPSDRIGEEAPLPPWPAAAGYVEEGISWLNLGSENQAPEGGRAEGPRILLADDNSDMRSYLSALLKAQGWLITAVGDGEEALASAILNPPDLVLTDVMMPQLDGFGLLAALKSNKNTRNVPVVMLSARAGEEARVVGMNAGADDYLVKPFSAKELVARINTHLQTGKFRAEAEAQRELVSVFAQSPAAIAVQEGSEHRFILANTAYVALLGWNRNIIGKPFVEALPELKAQGFKELLDNVYRTGETYTGRGLPLSLSLENGTTKMFLVDLTYKAKYDLRGKIDGVLTVALDVTEHVTNRAKLLECERSLSCPVAQVPKVPSVRSRLTPQNTDLSEKFVANQKLLGLRVLLAEDSSDNRYLITRFLSASGATVEVASNGSEAVEKALKSSFDMVLMDMEMPVLDGYAATTKLRDGGYQGPIIALTANSMVGEREKCLASGCDDYLSKPFKPVLLIDLVESTVRAAALAPTESFGISLFANDPLLGPLIAAFVKNLPLRVAALQSAQEHLDWPEIATLAHQMAGAAGGYGFPTMGRAAAKIESQARDHVPPDVLQSSIASFTSLCHAAIASSSQLH